jgi:hypothetical protein
MYGRSSVYEVASASMARHSLLPSSVGLATGKDSRERFWAPEDASGCFILRGFRQSSLAVCSGSKPTVVNNQNTACCSLLLRDRMTCGQFIRAALHHYVYLAIMTFKSGQDLAAQFVSIAAPVLKLCRIRHKSISSAHVQYCPHT